MALATRPKRTTHHKKRSGQHHRHSQPYLKTYWPYLPMLMIVGVGAVIDHMWAVGTSIALQPSQAVNSQFASTVQPASRLEALTGSHEAWLLSAVLGITIVAFALFVVRHSHRLHRSIVKGEAFVTRHPVFDIALVFVFTAGFILTNTTGLIG